MKASPKTVQIGARVMYLLSQFILRPKVSLPSHFCLQMIPTSGMEEASDPAHGLVSANAGIALPEANSGRYLFFC